MDAAARAAGALGTKILGAGGGGSVLVVLGAGDPGAVDAALDGFEVRRLPLELAAEGLRIRSP